MFLNWKYDGKGAKNNTHSHTHAKCLLQKVKSKKRKEKNPSHVNIYGLLRDTYLST